MTREEARKHIAETCGQGWLPLVDRFYDALPPGRKVEMVYQKWAALHFDVSPEPNDELYALLDEIEAMSQEMCQRCGAPAIECIEDGWVVSLCPEHARSAACVHMDGTAVT